MVPSELSICFTPTADGEDAQNDENLSTTTSRVPELASEGARGDYISRSRSARAGGNNYTSSKASGWHGAEEHHNNKMNIRKASCSATSNLVVFGPRGIYPIRNAYIQPRLCLTNITCQQKAPRGNNACAQRPVLLAQCLVRL